MVKPTKNMSSEDRKEFRKSVGRCLQELRKAAGFSSAASFAEHVGFNANTYTQYEQGVTGFDYEKAWIMADALGCSMDALGGRKSPGGDPSLSTDERGLVDSYRRMDEGDKPGFMTTARGLAYAGDAKKEGAGRPVGMAGELVGAREETE